MKQNKIIPRLCFVISVLFIQSIAGFPTKGLRNSYGLPIPPNPLHQGVYDKDYNARLIAERIQSWTSEDKENAWELSGLFEGDIMLNPSDGDLTKNGLINKNKRWPGGIVPIYIDDDDFDEDEIKLIKEGIKEYHQRTCLRFRPYNETDVDYVTIKGASTGCWSSVGRQGRGQLLNLQKKGCMKHGTIVHELLHALGFYHQQSAADRDDYVKIHWQNIKEGREHNFNKYNRKMITDYGIGYDYGSVMHYSAYAFSKNGERTITTLKEDAKIGQRMELSEKDVAKLQAMYKEECGDRKPEGTGGNDSDNSWIDSIDYWSRVDYQ